MSTLLHSFCKCVVISTIISISFNAHSQDISNRGTDFWVGYGSHVRMYNDDGSVDTVTGGDQDMILYFTSAKQAHVTVEIPLLGWSKTYFVDSNAIVESDQLPKKGKYDARLSTEGVSNKGIHITSDEPIAAYCHIYSRSVSGASVILPTSILGQDYYTLNFKQKSGSDHSYSYCFVVATEDSTLVEVTPSVRTQRHAPNSTFTAMLMKGQVLNLLGRLLESSDTSIYRGLDLSGTHIRSLGIRNGPRKKIAVFCGSGKVSILCALNKPSADNLIAQMFPSDAWGKTYITVPTVNMPNNFFRVLVKDPSTIVKLNGKRLTCFVDSSYYEFQSNLPNVIEADKNILVAQYITSQSQCGNDYIGNEGDPEMIYLSSVDQTINNATLIAPNRYQILEHHINVVINSTDTLSFLLDGKKVKNKFKQLQGHPEYSFATFDVAGGLHRLHADAGLNVYAYGYGSFESYGYNAGFYNKSNYNYLSLSNPYAMPKGLQTCRATPFKLSVTLLYQPESLLWDFMNNILLSPNKNITIDHPVADSVFIKSGTKYYVYILKETLSAASTGILPVNIYATKKLLDGGTSLQIINYKINVGEHPIANWQLNYDACKNDTLHFFDSSIAFDDNKLQWQWNFGDDSYSSEKNPLKRFASYGNYSVSFRMITGNGCFADTTQIVALNPAPIANFTIRGNTCINNNIIFQDASFVDRDNITYWNWNFNDAKTSALQQTEYAFNKSGDYNIKLTVATNNNCSADTIITIHIYDYPLVSAANELLVKENTSVQIKPTYKGDIQRYNWKPALYLNNDSIAYPVTSPTDNIIYQLSATGIGNCITTKNINVKVLHLLGVPNTFSPNGDGINDKWVLHNLEYFTNCSVNVFNRSGKNIYSSSAYNNAWDGTYNGKPLPVGTYYYVIKTQDAVSSTKTGYVTILK